MRRGELDELEELPQAAFLMPSQMLWLGEHAFDHLLGLVPLSVNARPHELLPRSRARAVRGDDVGNQGSKLVDDLHGSTSLDVKDEC